MRILVTGGTGVIGTAAVSELVGRGHAVRLLSRHADDDAKRWPGVEPFEGDVANAESLRGVTGGCDAMLHIAGVAVDDEEALGAINVTGTRNVVAEAMRSGVRRIVFVSSLGADRGASAYHRSKAEAEEIVRKSGLRWTIIRPGNVYGPGDEVISLMLKMVRALPALPTIDGGEQPFQPIWHEDLAKALAVALEREDLDERVLEVGGSETTSMRDVIERLRTITGRDPVTLPVPLAAAAAAASTGSGAPVDNTKLTMLRERNVIDGTNALTDVLQIEPTPLADGLRALADTLPEQLPDSGVGKLHHKRFFADIEGTRHTPATLMSLFRERGPDIMPVEFEAEPGTGSRGPGVGDTADPTVAGHRPPVGGRRIDLGVTLTGRLPLRGHFQVRAELVEPAHVVLATVEGHPLAGIVEFTAERNGAAIRFAIDTWVRAANVVDFVAMNTLGGPLQAANWRRTVQGVVDASGGTAPAGVQTTGTALDDAEAERVTERIRWLIRQRQRGESASPAEDAAQR